MKSAESSALENLPFELQALSQAIRYQRWISDLVNPYLGSSILEFGAGIGNLSQHLPMRHSLVLSEINPSFIDILQKKFSHKRPVSVLQLDSLRDQRLLEYQFDTIVSFNVLEHIEDDISTLRDGIKVLKASEAQGPKRIVTVVPAHQWAFGSFDRSFQHYRRYTDALFREKLEAAGASLTKENYYSRYLNIPGLLAWWLNGKVLKKKEIGPKSIRVFEALYPVIRPLDDIAHDLFKIPLGNSLLTIYSVT